MRFRQVHLDFHTSECIDGIGKDFDKKQFQDALKAGHVDSITVFSKCHHGWAYHPSKANTTHPGLKTDLLKAQIEAAHEIGVKTPVYLSAGFDEYTARTHPEWLIRRKDDTLSIAGGFSEPGYKLFCLNTGYLDYLLAQIREVLENYDADGIFLDIVSVGNSRCYCSKCREDIIRKGQNPFDEKAVTEHAEEVYANYTRRVRETIDSIRPGLPVFHNGGHIRRGRRDLAHMDSHLELESLPTGGWGYDHFPLSARYVQGLGMEYLGMTGKFHTSWGEFGGYKHPNAIRYETALSVANGAKCSIGDQLHPYGQMDMTTYEIIGAGYSEIEKKEPWLDNVGSVADIGVLSSEATNGTDSGYTIGKGDIGAVRMMLEGHYLFDVIDTEYDFEKYKVIILADDIEADENLRKRLEEYTANGGKVLASGKSAFVPDTYDFYLDFGAKATGKSEFKPDYMKPCFETPTFKPTSFIMYSDAICLDLCGGTELAKRENPFFNRTWEHFCSHRHSPSSLEYAGPGIVEGNDGTYISWNIFADYATEASLILKQAVFYALDRLIGDRKTLVTNLPVQGVTTLMKQSNERRYISHMLYASPVKRGDGIEVIEDIIPIYNINASYKFNEEIKKVYLAPQMEEVAFKNEDGMLSLVIPKIECHQMIVFEY